MGDDDVIRPMSRSALDLAVIDFRQLFSARAQRLDKRRHTAADEAHVSEGRVRQEKAPVGTTRSL